MNHVLWRCLAHRIKSIGWMGYFSIPFPTFAELAEPAGLSERERRSMERGGGGHRQTGYGNIYDFLPVPAAEQSNSFESEREGIPKGIYQAQSYHGAFFLSHRNFCCVASKDPDPDLGGGIVESAHQKKVVRDKTDKNLDSEEGFRHAG